MTLILPVTFRSAGGRYGHVTHLGPSCPVFWPFPGVVPSPAGTLHGRRSETGDSRDQTAITTTRRTTTNVS